jgi:hypothetical protein
MVMTIPRPTHRIGRTIRLTPKGGEGSTAVTRQTGSDRILGGPKRMSALLLSFEVDR